MSIHDTPLPMKALSLLIILFVGFSHLANAQWKPVAALPAESFFDLYATEDVLYASTTNRVYFSTDGGLNWTPSALIPAEDDEVSDLLVIDGVIYAAMLLNGCYISTDQGESWKQHNRGLNGLGATNLSALAVRNNKIYVGTVGSGVFEKPLDNPFSPWQPFSHNLLWGNVQSLCVDGEQLLAGAGANATLSRNKIGHTAWDESPFAAFNGNINLFLGAMRQGAILHGVGTQGLYRSIDDGAHWAHFNPGVGLVERAQLVEWQDQPLVLLTKPNGSFLRISKDQGETWSVFQAALPKKNLGFDLLNYAGKLFYAASDGVWVLSPTVPTQNPVVADFELGQNHPNPSNDAYTTIPFRLEQGTTGRLSVFDVLGRVVHQRDLGKLGAGKHESRIDISNLNKGIYVYALEVEGKVLSKRMVIE